MPCQLLISKPLLTYINRSHVRSLTQTHASARVKFFMEFGGNCVTADYKMMGGANKDVIVVRWADPTALRRAVHV